MNESRADRLARFMLKKVNKAVYRFDMIRDGDRIAVALSGGKDSFGLLEVLRYRLHSAPEKYEIAAIHVIGDARGPAIPHPDQLQAWLEERGIPRHIRRIHLAPDEQLPMTCGRCAWNRRRTLFEMARELGCNKLAFGHHLDDFAETALMNLIRHGKCETMSPTGEYFNGVVRVIRPLLFVPERELMRFAAASGFPAPPDACPLGACTQRARAKELIALMAKDARKVRENLLRASLREASGADEEESYEPVR